LAKGDDGGFGWIDGLSEQPPNRLARRTGAHKQMKCALLLSAALLAPSGCAPMVEVVPSPVAPTALVMAGLRAEARGDTTGAVEHYQRALEAARTLYGTEHPNAAFAHAALGIWHARFGRVEDALRHLRESRRIEETQGAVFVNIAETRLPADGSDPVARALIRLRLRRDLVLCAQDRGCTGAHVLSLGEALGALNP